MFVTIHLRKKLVSNFRNSGSGIRIRTIHFPDFKIFLSSYTIWIDGSQILFQDMSYNRFQSHWSIHTLWASGQLIDYLSCNLEVTKLTFQKLSILLFFYIIFKARVGLKWKKFKTYILRGHHNMIFFCTVQSS